MSEDAVRVTESASAAKGSARGLRKVNMGSWGITFILYCLVAAGAFGIEEMVSTSGPGVTILILAILPFIWARPLSNLVAECNAVLPCEGGAYVWAREAFGEFWGFQVGIWNAAALYISSGTYVVLAASYMGMLLPLDDTGLFLVKFVLVALCVGVNLAGLREVEHASTIFSVLIIIVFAAVAIVGFATWQTNPVVPFVSEGMSVSEGIAESFALGIWLYCGYDCIATMSGEIVDSNVIAKGLRRVAPIIALSYILPTLAALASLESGSWEFWGIGEGENSEVLGYATVLTRVIGPAGGAIFLVVAIVSQMSIYNTSLTSVSRSLMVLSQDGLFPKFVAKVDEKGRSPYVCILFVGLSSLAFAQLDFTTLVEIEVAFDLALYMVLALTAWKLRKMYPVEERKKQGLFCIGGGKPGFGLCAGLVFVVCVFALVMEGASYVPLALAAIVSGIAMYVLFKKVYGGLSQEDPEKYPLDERTGLDKGDAKQALILMAGTLAVVALMLFCGF